MDDRGICFVRAEAGTLRSVVGTAVLRYSRADIDVTVIGVDDHSFDAAVTELKSLAWAGPAAPMILVELERSSSSNTPVRTGRVAP